MEGQYGDWIRKFTVIMRLRRYGRRARMGWGYGIHLRTLGSERMELLGLAFTRIGGDV